MHRSLRYQRGGWGIPVGRWREDAAQPGVPTGAVSAGNAGSLFESEGRVTRPRAPGGTPGRRLRRTTEGMPLPPRARGRRAPRTAIWYGSAMMMSAKASATLTLPSPVEGGGNSIADAAIGLGGNVRRTAALSLSARTAAAASRPTLCRASRVARAPAWFGTDPARTAPTPR